MSTDIRSPVALIDKILAFVEARQDRCLEDFEIEDLNEFDRQAYATGLIPPVRSPKPGERTAAGIIPAKDDQAARSRHPKLSYNRLSSQILNLYNFQGSVKVQ